ncbi:hypothetical protein GLOTRDRAFT_140188 [Gloeophyllum trabeum ATCC 11539]|uniref:Uncharacterized protein n=1 Tax=Gloeophyllum trabeum (strain ATCC 11539 / FP-39264 / Madison 617) TaxID=670483 RepID=S7PYL0_GLOTA|nr:uncharacterized protein GLOTRDRAFT_140188 [Gloeophyllum trabeum ATCC 11539]EPQ52422.1 hypothetical protein GLOTRDRAFT_140188 [Gloeophyllum trabeum ATCC 11539]
MRYALALVAAVLAIVPSIHCQSVAIGYPPAGTTVAPGSNFTVQVDKPNSLTGSTDVSLIIALHACTTNASGALACTSPAEEMGTILYSGPYAPQYTNASGTGEKPPHQNFSVAVPATGFDGVALLSVGHVALVGAGNSPMFEVVYVDVQVASSSD